MLEIAPFRLHKQDWCIYLKFCDFFNFWKAYCKRNRDFCEVCSLSETFPLSIKVFWEKHAYENVFRRWVCIFLFLWYYIFDLLTTPAHQDESISMTFMTPFYSPIYIWIHIVTWLGDMQCKNRICNLLFLIKNVLFLYFLLYRVGFRCKVQYRCSCDFGYLYSQGF